MGEASTPKATIVVPVYNSASSIRRCLDSLLAQSERSIQVVCVNDGSADDSLRVLRQIAQTDDRVLVIDQKNAGVSCARNAGIDAAEGEVVFFVDADDYIDAQTVERVLQAMGSSDAEVTVFGGVCEPADAAPKRVQQLMSPNADTFGTRDPQLLFHANAQPYACRAAFSRALLNREGIRFAPGLALGEDVVFQFAAYALASKTVVMPDKFYHYVMESDSATHEFNSDEARAKKLDAHMMMLEEVLEDWAVYGLLDLCPGELVTWFLDLIVFDLARLGADDFHRDAGRVNRAFTTFLGTEWADMPAKGAVRRVAHKLVAATSSVSMADATLFYLSTRGLKACLERFL